MPYSVRAGVKSSIVRVYFLSYLEERKKNQKKGVTSLTFVVTQQYQIIPNIVFTFKVNTSKSEKLTFVLLLELPEAVPFILQYCSASLAMSEINF